MDDQARMSPESQRKTFLVFINAVRTRFGLRYLKRKPTVTELQGIFDGYAARGCPGCVGSLDCMKNCPRALKGQFHNPRDGKLAAISCDAVTDGDLYCWHWFAGRLGTNDEKSVLVNSPLFMDVLSGRRRMLLPDEYFLDGVRRQWLLYFLGDGAYPRWAIFHLPDATPTTEKEKYAAVQQVAARKDVERLSGCLRGRWGIMRRERHEWSDEIILLIAQVCVILHNMIVSMCKSGELDEEGGAEGGGNLVEKLCDDAPPAEGVDGAPVAAGAPVPEVGLLAPLDRAHTVKDDSSHVA